MMVLQKVDSVVFQFHRMLIYTCFVFLMQLIKQRSFLSFLGARVLVERASGATFWTPWEKHLSVTAIIKKKMFMEKRIN